MIGKLANAKRIWLEFEFRLLTCLSWASLAVAREPEKRKVFKELKANHSTPPSPCGARRVDPHLSNSYYLISQTCCSNIWGSYLTFQILLKCPPSPTTSEDPIALMIHLCSRVVFHVAPCASPSLFSGPRDLCLWHLVASHVALCGRVASPVGGSCGPMWLHM